MDDFVDRFLKTIGLICAGFVLLYILIVISGERPTGVNLLIYNGMNWLFYWLFRIIALGLFGFVLVFILTKYREAQAEKERLIQEEVKERERKIKEAELRKEEMHQKRIEAQRKTKARREAVAEKLRRMNCTSY